MHRHMGKESVLFFPKFHLYKYVHVSVVEDGTLVYNTENERCQLASPHHAFWISLLVTASCLRTAISFPLRVTSFGTIIFFLKNLLIITSKNIMEGSCPLPFAPFISVPCDCSLSSCWNTRMKKGTTYMLYPCCHPPAVRVQVSCWRARRAAALLQTAPSLVASSFFTITIVIGYQWMLFFHPILLCLQWSHIRLQGRSQLNLKHIPLPNVCYKLEALGFPPEQRAQRGQGIYDFVKSC